MFIFRLYAQEKYVESTQKRGFDIILAALNEKAAIAKAKKTVLADNFLIREVTQKTLWEKMQRE